MLMQNMIRDKIRSEGVRERKGERLLKRDLYCQASVVMWCDVIGQQNCSSNKSAYFLVKVLESEGEVAEPWPVGRGQRPAPPHQDKPAGGEVVGRGAWSVERSHDYSVLQASINVQL